MGVRGFWGTVGFLLALAMAHGAVPEREEAFPLEARLFALDNRPGYSRLVAVDLPQGQVVAELSLPPRGMSLVATPSGRYLLVSRGRDVDRQWLTVVWTGKEEGRWSRPVIAKSLLLGREWNIGHGAEAYTLGGRLLAFAERDALAFRFDEEALDPKAAFQPETLRLPNSDHYHVVEAPEGTYLTLLARGQVVLLDRDLRNERGRFSCPVQHGEAFHGETGRSFFACARDVLVLEGGKELTRLAYPAGERIGAFLEGDGVFFGYSDRVAHLQRLDPVVPSLTPIPLGGVFVRGKADGKRLYVLLTDGRLQVREARDGKLLREIRVSRPFPEMDEDTGGAIYPDLAPWPERGLLYVSLPHMGLLAEVDVERGRVVRYLRTGGNPTRPSWCGHEPHARLHVPPGGGCGPWPPGGPGLPESPSPPGGGLQPLPGGGGGAPLHGALVPGGPLPQAQGAVLPGAHPPLCPGGGPPGRAPALWGGPNPLPPLPPGPRGEGAGPPGGGAGAPPAPPSSPCPPPSKGLEGPLGRG